jgi:branched-subunit amino acid ABC-type transport system permease component
MSNSVLVSEGFSLFYQYADSISLLMLSAVGLMIIFGMMGVINMAHGELIFIGAYTTSVVFYAGAPLFLAIPAGALAAGAFGVVLERLIIRRFYGQLLSSLVVTWGLSLLLGQGFLLVIGPSIRSLPTPFGSFSVGGFTYSYYRLFMLAVAFILVGGVWALLKYTKFGVEARATMENPQMAHALGINVDKIYMLTFALGAALAGIAGSLFALQSPIEPTFGRNYTPIAFITVVVGGSADIVSGLVASALSLSAIRTIFTSQFNILIGHVSMLVAAFVFIRFVPNGVSELLEIIRARRTRD